MSSFRRHWLNELFPKQIQIQVFDGLTRISVMTTIPKPFLNHRSSFWTFLLPRNKCDWWPRVLNILDCNIWACAWRQRITPLTYGLPCHNYSSTKLESTICRQNRPLLESLICHLNLVGFYYHCSAATVHCSRCCHRSWDLPTYFLLPYRPRMHTKGMPVGPYLLLQFVLDLTWILRRFAHKKFRLAILAEK